MWSPHFLSGSIAAIRYVGLTSAAADFFAVLTGVRLGATRFFVLPAGARFGAVRFFDLPASARFGADRVFAFVVDVGLGARPEFRFAVAFFALPPSAALMGFLPAACFDPRFDAPDGASRPVSLPDFRTRATDWGFLTLLTFCPTMRLSMVARLR